MSADVPPCCLLPAACCHLSIVIHCAAAAAAAAFVFLSFLSMTFSTFFSIFPSFLSISLDSHLPLPSGPPLQYLLISTWLAGGHSLTERKSKKGKKAIKTCLKDGLTRGRITTPWVQYSSYLRDLPSGLWKKDGSLSLPPPVSATWLQFKKGGTPARKDLTK